MFFKQKRCTKRVNVPKVLHLTYVGQKARGIPYERCQGVLSVMLPAVPLVRDDRVHSVCETVYGIVAALRPVVNVH